MKESAWENSDVYNIKSLYETKASKKGIKKENWSMKIKQWKELWNLKNKTHSKPVHTNIHTDLQIPLAVLFRS